MKLLVFILSMICAQAASVIPQTPARGSSSSVGETYYVAAAGDDSNPGTLASPWLTVARVNGTNFNAGDRILFNRGDTWNERLVVPSSGTPASPLTFSAYGSGALPNLVAASGRAECVTIATTRSNVVTSFFKFSGGDAASASALWENNGENNTIQDCTVDGEVTLADSCISGGADSHTYFYRNLIINARDDGFTIHSTASYYGSSNVFTLNRSAINNSGTAMSGTLEDCTFYENGTGADSSKGDVNALSIGTFIFNRCRFTAHTAGTSHGFVIGSGDAGENATFNYCVFDNRVGATLAAGSWNAAVGSTHNYNNCVFVGNTGGDGNSGSLNGNTGTINLVNCIFFQQWRILATGGGVVNADHCLFRNVASMGTITSNTSSLGTGDPLFVNYATGDFHIQTGSPVINAGVAIGGLTLDLDRVAVGNPPEAGAYEF